MNRVGQTRRIGTRLGKLSSQLDTARLFCLFSIQGFRFLGWRLERQAPNLNLEGCDAGGLDEKRQTRLDTSGVVLCEVWSGL